MQARTLLSLTITALLSIVFLNTASAQTGKRAQNVYLEVGGPGLSISANYDTRFGDHRDGLGGRVGVGYLPAAFFSIVAIPVQLNYLLGKKSHFLELGAGATYLKIGDDNGNDKDNKFLSFNAITGVMGTATVGYRYQPVNGGFNFRVSANPIVEETVQFTGGISVGWTF
ncbi:hypothetical protein DJ568_01190 [Mucilaginibacter hurinus]|uniref:Outer membrane protein beta-barrel domain-containing protein n=1 Tax=Mucilaginibacter hurinus TaxID=2201324 RepID=A0A367GSU8_9SPHI|nr:hypothetical protein [Mucilaginibacter hurinus]RCH56502.1 hypothetical protein DJ568_01190 [Mucilaginibacter hurinus]